MGEGGDRKGRGRQVKMVGIGGHYLENERKIFNKEGIEIKLLSIINILY